CDSRGGHHFNITASHSAAGEKSDCQQERSAPAGNEKRLDPPSIRYSVTHHEEKGGSQVETIGNQPPRKVDGGGSHQIENQDIPSPSFRGRRAAQSYQRKTDPACRRKPRLRLYLLIEKEPKRPG